MRQTVLKKMKKVRRKIRRRRRGRVNLVVTEIFLLLNSTSFEYLKVLYGLILRSQ
jgi:hypothetical protein